MLQLIIPLILFLFPLAYSPGPGNIFFAANGARFGFRATLPANTAYHLVTWVVTAAIGLGFITALERVPQVFTLLKFAGSLYVLWLAWKLFRAGTIDSDVNAQTATFMDGAVLMLLNPKAYVIIALMFTQFLDQSEWSTFATVMLIATVFTLNNLIAFSLWALVGDRIAGQFRTAESARTLNRLFGGILALVAIWMLVS